MKNSSWLIYRILAFFFGPIFKWYYNVKIINKDVIPKEGPIILCGNHRNFKDQFPVIISTPRVIHWMSKKEYFDGPFAFLFKILGCISVDRENHGGDSLIIASEYLKKGGAIGIFPEGTRNKTEKELLDFKIGTVYLAEKTGATVVPFAITGDFKFRSKNTKVEFGEPFIVDKGSNLKEINNKLYEEILNLYREK